MITPKNLLFSTFVGLQVEIISSSQRNLIGVKGTIIDETKNLLVIETENKRVHTGKENVKEKKLKEIKVPKISSVFRFTVDGGQTVTVEGSGIAFRPHERPKKV